MLPLRIAGQQVRSKKALGNFKVATENRKSIQEGEESDALRLQVHIQLRKGCRSSEQPEVQFRNNSNCMSTGLG